MKTFSTMDELYEALKPFELDDLVWLYLSHDSVELFGKNNDELGKIKIKHNMPIPHIWVIPRPIDLTKYIGKVVKTLDNHSQYAYILLTQGYIELLNTGFLKSIEPLTIEDIQP